MFLYFCGKDECRTKEKKSMEALSFDNILGEQEIQPIDLSRFGGVCFEGNVSPDRGNKSSRFMRRSIVSF